MARLRPVRPQRLDANSTSGPKALSYSTYLYKTDYDGNQTNWTTLDDIEPCVSYQHEAVSDPTYGQMVAVYHEDDDEFATNNSSYSGLYEAYEFDTQGRQTAITKPVYKNAANPNVAVTQKTFYYPDGHASEGQIQYVVFNYKVANWTSDKANQTSTENVQFEFTYDDDGNRETCIYPLDMVKSFDDFENDTGYEQTESQFVRGYNAEGRLEIIIKPEGTINYTYDTFGSLASMNYYNHTVSYDYDFFGRLKTARTTDLDLSYQYNEVGKKTHVANLATGSDESYEYDSLGRVEKVTHENDEGEIIFESDYVIGSDGNRIGVIERRNNSYVTWEYEYDELGRLTSEKRATKFVDLNDNMHILDGDRTRHVTYTYDVDSNRKSETDELASSTKDYYYESNSQRLDYINEDNQLYEDYTWHPGGQQKSRTKVNGDTEEYFWTGENLTSIKFTGGTNDRLSIHYNYDENNTLIERKVVKTSDGDVIDHVKYLVDNKNLTGYSQVVAELRIKSDGSMEINSHQYLHQRNKKPAHSKHHIDKLPPNRRPRLNSLLDFQRDLRTI